MEGLGSDFSNSKFSWNMKINQTIDHKDGKWSISESDLYELEGRWLILEFNIMAFTEPVFVYVDEIEDDVMTCTHSIELRTLRMTDAPGYNMKAISKIHVLEPEEVTYAKEVINEIEQEKLQYSLDTYLAFHAYVILKVKDLVEDTHVASLINTLKDNMNMEEEMKDESEVLGEEISKYESKTKKDQGKFYESIPMKKFLDTIEKETTDISEMSIEEVLTQARVISEKSDDEHIHEIMYWLESLSEVRDEKIDEMIRMKYYDMLNQSRF